MGSTFSSLKDDIRFESNEATDTNVLTPSNLGRIANKAARMVWNRIASHRPALLLSEAKVTYATGSRGLDLEVALASMPIRVMRVHLLNSDTLPENGAIGELLRYREPQETAGLGEDVRGWTLIGSSTLLLQPTPQDVCYLYVGYVPEYTTMTSDADKVLLGYLPACEDVVTEVALMLLAKRERDPNFMGIVNAFIDTQLEAFAFPIAPTAHSEEYYG